MRKAVVLGGGAVAAGALAWVAFTQFKSDAPPIDPDDISGTVTSETGPEAGVWVIAETTDLPTKYAKIVVTDDMGKYVLPDLPEADYDIWVRGYGLVDSPKVQARPGEPLDLDAVIAPSAAAAAEYYPAIYWYSMLRIPGEDAFPGTGTGAGGNGIPDNIDAQGEWLEFVKIDGCLSCHQLGNKATRTFPIDFPEYTTSLDKWTRRIQSGQASQNMVRAANWLGSDRILPLLADWTDRIAAGELPHAQPERPQGVERNIVVTLWDWGTPTLYIDDQGSAGRSDPHLNPYGPIWGPPEVSADTVPVLDPRTHTATLIDLPVRDPNTPTTRDLPIFAPSPYWGDELIWDSQGNSRHAMHDAEGRVWITTRIRPHENPDWCGEDSDHPSAQAFPLAESTRQLAFYVPETAEFTTIDTCFTSHHMYLDANNVMWFSGDAETVGWLDLDMYFATGDEQASQGWTPVIIDTNGNGRRDDYVEPNDEIDPGLDKRMPEGFYGVAVNPVDNTIWGTMQGFPGAIMRVDPGDNPINALSEFYELPGRDDDMPGYAPRGIDVDSAGIVWVSLISGHLARFDRSACPVLNGPTVTGAHCDAGWTLYPFPGPQFQGVEDVGSAEGGYFTYVDRYNTFGLGADVPFNTANISDSLVGLVNGEFVELRVPYPMGFYAKALDARIDDPNAGWKGRGLWSGFSGRAVQHIEGGKGTTSKVVQFQLRPDPLAH
jgi:hypothetical protein